MTNEERQQNKIELLQIQRSELIAERDRLRAKLRVLKASQGTDMTGRALRAQSAAGGHTERLGGSRG